MHMGWSVRLLWLQFLREVQHEWGSKPPFVRSQKASGCTLVHAGSTFYCSFPVAQDASWWKEALAATRILLVEDEGLIRMITADILRAEGFDVTEAWDSTEAARLLDGIDGFDALLTDVQMPGLADGIDVAVHARRRNPDISVLILSGYAPNLRSRLAALAPAAAYISKPYVMDDVMQVLHNLMNTPPMPPAGLGPSGA